MDEVALKKKTVLVTGARGFIGTAVRNVLRTHGAAVRGVGRSVSDSRSDSDPYSAVDLTDETTTTNLITKVSPDYIIHLAGCSIAKRELEWVQRTFAANTLTTVNLLSAAQQAAVKKTVIAGSLEQPDDISGQATLSSPYAASKWAASGYAKMFHTVFGLPVATARIHMVYGPGQKELQKMIPYVCLATIAGTAPELMSGTRLVDWIYVDDVAAGLVRMLLDGPEDGSFVDIGTGQLVATGDVASKICQLDGMGMSPVIGALPDRKLERESVANVERTQRQIDWSPQISLEEGLKRTLAFYRDRYPSGKLASDE